MSLAGEWTLDASDDRRRPERRAGPQSLRSRLPGHAAGNTSGHRTSLRQASARVATKSAPRRHLVRIEGAPRGAQRGKALFIVVQGQSVQHLRVCIEDQHAHVGGVSQMQRLHEGFRHPLLAMLLSQPSMSTLRFQRLEECLWRIGEAPFFRREPIKHVLMQRLVYDTPPGDRDQRWVRCCQRPVARARSAACCERKYSTDSHDTGPSRSAGAGACPCRAWPDSR